MIRRIRSPAVMHSARTRPPRCYGAGSGAPGPALGTLAPALAEVLWEIVPTDAKEIFLLFVLVVVSVSQFTEAGPMGPITA